MGKTQRTCVGAGNFPPLVAMSNVKLELNVATFGGDRGEKVDVDGVPLKEMDGKACIKWEMLSKQA